MARKPNVLLIMTDQQRYDTIHSLGNPYIQTPVLDRLAARSTAYTSAYCASPVCIASRCSLLLGQWAHQTGCEMNCAMPQERLSLMEMLHEAGYQTHGVGKMHFAPDSRKLWGFESRDYSEEGGFNPDDDFCKSLAAAGYDYVVAPNGVRSEYYYLPQPSQLPARLHHTTWTVDRSLEFLQRRDKDRPFFLWTSFIKPHPPFELPVPWNRLYKPVELPYPFMPPYSEELLTYWNHVQNRYKYRDQGFDGNLVRLIKAAYYASISFIDYNVGRLLDYLESEGLLDDTLIIYTSDHGELLGDYGAWGKRSLIDAASRIPLLVSYPERFEQGAVAERVCSNVDLLLTILSACGLEAPDDRPGVDLAELASGRAEREGIFCQYQRKARALYGFVSDSFKYIYSVPDEKEWLFRRAEGQPETTNLAGHPVYASVLAELRGKLLEEFRRTGYTEPLDGDAFKRYGKLQVPETPDAGQLFQEGRDVAGDFPPGYYVRCNPYQAPPPRFLDFGTKPTGNQ